MTKARHLQNILGCHYGSLFIFQHEHRDDGQMMGDAGRDVPLYAANTPTYINQISVHILFQLDFFHRLTLNQYGLVIGVGRQILFALQFLDDPIR